MTKERPILFSAPMVRALLAGSKTQTRRVAKEFAGRDDLDGVLRRFPQQSGCPHGEPGSRLWVREACQAHEQEDGLDGVLYRADGAFRAIEHTQAASEAWCALNAYRGKRGAVVSPIHMPRWASRITLEITDVRVERLQDVGAEDAQAEGIHRIAHGREGYYYHATRTQPHPNNWVYPEDAFRELWDSINAKRGHCWATNPWVWVIEFRQIIKSQPEKQTT